MDWIPLYRALSRHPKSRRLARYLEIGVPQVVGHLCLLWSWAVEWAPDGDLLRYSNEDIADACMWTGDVELLMEGLEASGFICQHQLHDWDQYTGKHLAKWEADRARKRRGTSAEPPRPLRDGGTEPRRIDVEVDVDLEEPKNLEPLAQDEPERMHDATDEKVSKPRFSAAEFAQFWELYPRKVGKRRAESAYRRALGRAQAGVIHAGAERLRTDPNLPERQYVPHPETWLNRDGWDDEPLPARLVAVGGRFRRDDPLPPEVS